MDLHSGNILIREYHHPTDYQTVYSVWGSVGKGIHISFSDQFEELEKLVTKSPGLFFVAEDGDQIIGTVMGGFDGRRGLIYHLAVLPEYQNLHIGTRLLARVEEALCIAGCRKIYLFIVPENMDRADFYEKRGYQHMDVVPFTKILEKK